MVPNSHTNAILPDTQYYALCRNEHLRRQSTWVADNAERRNIVAAIGLGDLTEHNSPEQWDFVRQALEPMVEVVPTFLATGNHDHGLLGSANNRLSLFRTTFPEAPGAARSALVEARDPGDIENAYYRVRFGSVNIGVLVLEWSPRSKTVEWANDVLTKNPSDRAIVVTHAYLYYDSTRYDARAKGDTQEWNVTAYGTAYADLENQTPNPEGAYDGEMLWRELVSRHAGVFLTLNGHVLANGTGFLVSTGQHGNRVNQVLLNYQMLDEGGLGYLRLLEFLPDGRTLRMKTFSPSLGTFALAPDQNFDLTVEPSLW